MLLPRLGERLSAISSLVKRAERAAEIGADHGILSAHLLASEVAGRMVVADVSAASLEKAKRLFARFGLSGRADFVVADGLDALAEPVSEIVIAGMGAGTMRRILERGADKTQGAALVLQPNLDHAMLRRFLAENGFYIEREQVAREGGRFYVAMRAVPGVRKYSEKEIFLGPCLLQSWPEHYAEYLLWRRGCLLEIRDGSAGEELSLIDDAFKKKA